MEFRTSAVKILSNSNFNKIIRGNDRSYFYSKLKSYQRANQIENVVSNLDFIKELYKTLLNNYRNEYIYKNTIFNKIVLGQHSLRTTTLLNEFKIGKSIADTVILNGHAHVIEIKTELDSLQKLEKQISDYKKAFGFISVVLHETDLKNYIGKISNNVGILALTRKNQLSEIRKPKEDFSALNAQIIQKCLRKSEFSEIVKEYYGFIPKVPNTLYYKACGKLLQEIPVIDLHHMMMIQLKQRNQYATHLLDSELTPKELKYICYCLNLTPLEYETLQEFLNEKVI